MLTLNSHYKLLNSTSNELSSYISPVKFTPNDISFDEHENKLQKNYVDAHNEFVQHFSDNKIYLNDNIISLIDNYLNQVSEIYNDYSKNHFLKNLGDKPDAEIRTKAFTAYKKIPEKIVPIRKEIEKEFRDILER